MWMAVEEVVVEVVVEEVVLQGPGSLHRQIQPLFLTIALNSTRPKLPLL